MDSVRRWCTSNELCLNEKKTVQMLFSLKNHVFVNPEATKFLGVYMSAPSLKFDEHAERIGSVISRNIFLLRTLMKSVSSDVAKTAYHALVQSFINYSILAWGNSHASGYIFRLQRRAVRVLFGLGYRENCREAFVALNIMTLPSVYVLESILYAYCNKSTFRSCSDVHSYNTRRRDDLYVQYGRLSVAQRGPIRTSQMLFNKLPSCMRSLPLRKLKAELKLFLIRNAFYSIDEFLNCNFVVTC